MGAANSRGTETPEEIVGCRLSWTITTICLNLLIICYGYLRS